jgi:periplasmic protein TonB
MTIVGAGFVWVLFKAHPLALLEGAFQAPIKTKTRIQVKEEVPPQPPPVTASVVSKNLIPQSAQMQMPSFSGQTYGSGGAGGLRTGNGEQLDEGLSEARNESRAPQPSGQQKIEYPQFAKSKGLKGFVVIQALIGMSGVVEQIRILQTEPAGIFDQYVLAEIRKWKFLPGLEKGQVKPLWWTQKVRFDYE